MSQFYSRYVPPAHTVASTESDPAQSRKRQARESAALKSSKKRKFQQQDGATVLAKYSSTAASARQRNNGVEAVKGNASKLGENSHLGLDESQTQNIITQSTKLDATDEISSLSKHSRILSRFKDAREKSAKHAADLGSGDESEQNAVVLHDLNPIPQPKPTPITVANPTYATAPEWLRNPIKVDSQTRKEFSGFELGKVLLKNLRTQNKELALPVQTAVLPLLLNIPLQQRSDLCIAAATGSGKTFAYLLPILQDLRNRVEIRLRAVIVVPTRALVKQVVQAIDSCSTGVDIIVGTAEGTQTLAEEQRKLIAQSSVYDMQEWENQQDTPIDWSTFSLEETVREAGESDLTTSIGFITEYHSNIDILVCTPGRLIEHLQSTKGFNLDDVHWFVGDEADRLLDESYHEWLQTVLPALQSRNASKQRDELLKTMYMTVPNRRVTKILLSATMTRDISQLLALDLNNPKLVFAAEQNDQQGENHVVQSVEETEFNLPLTLNESSIAFKDVENKPLYLVNLLNNHILSQHIAKKQFPQEMRPDTSASQAGTVGLEYDSEEDLTTSDSSSESDRDTSSVSSASTSSGLSGVSSTGHSLDNNTSKLQQSRVLVFTKSTESAHRLSRLLGLIDVSLKTKISTYTRTSSSSASLQHTQSQVLQAFRTGKTPILVCTDLAARGLDIPNLEHVVNYDMPSSVMTYVHRVGRTARAGEEGQAWTLVEHKQGKWFWENIGGKINNRKDAEKKLIGRGSKSVQKLGIQLDMEVWGQKYEYALNRLGNDVKNK